MKVIDNAENEIYFATRYYDPHVSNMVFNKLGKGVSIHVLDGNPEQFTVAVSKYDDVYFAQRFIGYFKLLSKNAFSPKLLQKIG
jgi:hypothetical protein